MELKSQLKEKSAKKFGRPLIVNKNTINKLRYKNFKGEFTNGESVELTPKIDGSLELKISRSFERSFHPYPSLYSLYPIEKVGLQGSQSVLAKDKIFNIYVEIKGERNAYLIKESVYESTPAGFNTPLSKLIFLTTSAPPQATGPKLISVNIYQCN